MVLRMAVQFGKGVNEMLIELTPVNLLLMAGIFVAVAVTFVICIRRELR